MESEEMLQLIYKGETIEIEFKSWVKARSKKELMGVITKEAVAKEFVRFILEEQETKQKLFNTVEVMILHYLKENKSINIEEAAKLVQLEDVDTRNILNELVECGYLERNNRKFIFTQRVYGAFGEDIGYIKDKTVYYIRAKRMIVEYIDKKGFITNKIAQELCSYDDSQSQYTLKKMAEENLISLVGKGRGSKYIKTEN